MSLHPQLEANKTWVDRLGIDGHSGDESDHKATKIQYIIKGKPWRSAELTEYLRALDALHMSTRFSRQEGQRKEPGRVFALLEGNVLNARQNLFLTATGSGLLSGAQSAVIRLP